MVAGLGLLNHMENIAKRHASAQNTFELVQGEVKQINPLVINNGKIALSESMLLLSRNVIETWINVPTHTESGHQHLNKQPADSHGDTETEFTDELALPKIKLWRGLKVGDQVRMLRISGGQMYYVMERIGGVLNDT